MNDKEKADCLIELQKMQIARFRQTRDIEFKVNIAIWTLIVLAGSFLIGKVHPNGLFIIIVAFAVFFMHMSWMIFIQCSENKDNYYFRKYRSHVEKLVGVVVAEEIKDEKEKASDLSCGCRFRKKICELWVFFKKNWNRWVCLEVGFTILLLVVVALLIKNPVIKNPECSKFDKLEKRVRIIEHKLQTLEQKYSK